MAERVHRNFARALTNSLNDGLDRILSVRSGVICSMVPPNISVVPLEAGWIRPTGRISYGGFEMHALKIIRIIKNHMVNIKKILLRLSCNRQSVMSPC
jgi:hypothetical protein